MKNVFKATIAFLLAFSARAVVRRYSPKIVMITGSVGKTSTKDAVATVLSTRFFIRSSEKSFNSEFGVPFTILGVENPWNNPMAWISLLKRTLALLFLPNHYPNMLVLEVGADKPGDLMRILRIATPDAVVVTRLPEIPVHVEAYASPEAVREEEFSPAYALAPGAPLIIPLGGPYASRMAARTAAKVLSYGSADEATVHVSALDFYEEHGTVVGMEATVVVGNERGHLVVRGSIGKTQILPAAAALATAVAFDISLPDALVALEKYEPPPGRGRLFSGKNGSVVIDDSYNASPAAVEEALRTLAAFPHAARRIAILGDMLELGRYSVAEHERLGALARDAADMVVAVGIRARAFVAVPGDTDSMEFGTAYAAAAALPDIVRAGDVILVKGSQSVRTERIVKALLAHPEDYARLVRQEKRWGKKV
ncbi:MAG TPA: UDP-N-acetylmuramoyl-tripeptide--D-alanyl-D-alanine ligase [Candidatus Paceibacterota bacterium]|nr:UDP-N-acetylmuramoyl-tripeptide--D-alanyl-D-alanine ligase [Candidatus Paceibacterota bacterium]